MTRYCKDESVGDTVKEEKEGRKEVCVCAW